MDYIYLVCIIYLNILKQKLSMIHCVWSNRLMFVGSLIKSISGIIT